MRNIDHYPKTFKKTIRYIRQDATLEQLEGMKKILNYYIHSRRKELEKLKKE